MSANFNLSNGERTRYVWNIAAPKGTVLLVHGYAEHAGRYGHVAQALNDAGYDVVAYDQIGHGTLADRLGYYDNIFDLVDDLAEVVSLLQAQVSTPLFVLGHSMGGLVTSLFVTRNQPQLAGVVLSSALLAPDADVSPLLIKLSGVISKIAPKLPAVQLDSQHISRDAAVVAAYDADPLVPRGGVPARVGNEFLRGMRYVAAHASNFSLPAYLFHGRADKLANPDGSQQLFDTMATTDKTLKYYRDLYHETLNEPEQAQVLTDLIAWLDARC